MWNPRWGNPRLDSATGALISSADAKDNKHFWIETEFDKPLDVYQVILKRRADTFDVKLPNATQTMLQRRVNRHIYIQYKDPVTKKWLWYKGERYTLLPTGQTENSTAEEE